MSIRSDAQRAQLVLPTTLLILAALFAPVASGAGLEPPVDPTGEVSPSETAAPSA